jgi:ABC-type transport system substrate-binding protein
MLGNRKWSVLSAVLVTGGVLLASCARPTPEVIQVEVTRVVEVEGEFKTVVETETIVVTATPEPREPVKSESPNTLYAVSRGDPDTLDPAQNYEDAGCSIILNVYEQLGFIKEQVPALMV